MNEQQEAAAREAFEAMISAPPFEQSIFRFGDDPRVYAWPGSYRNYYVELAWQAYLAAHARQQAVIDAKDAEIARLREESESWEETYLDTKRIVDEELSPRIAELERQLALMRACVEAADAMRGRHAGYGNAEMEASRNGYDAARALIGASHE